MQQQARLVLALQWRVRPVSRRQRWEGKLASNLPALRLGLHPKQQLEG